MTDTRNNGGPAFPHSVKNWNDHIARAEDGMSLRDWFAGQALAGLMATQSDAQGWFKPKDAATSAYEMADAMLATRSSSKEA